ncbi:WD40 repeat-like protein [Rickenella mellea]|uniref:Ribosome biogenesis protein YTM1 n=1 Tax=Rickenella mellea TaxID=50990 RepID=A0A4Y7Q6V0_9AGAM|nr:WD40 repeat-like protein [Rickenella mellea]
MAEGVTLPVVFTTQTPYPIPAQKFMIPATWKRYQLSQLINKSLSLPKPVPFDFLIKGEVLRVSLAEWCSEKDFGMEETLQIEYIESVMPPQRMADIPHDDWVSSVVCLVPGFFVTGSYDGVIRVFNSSQKLTQTVSGHTAPITSVCILHSRQTGDAYSDAETRIIASASHDLTARLTSLSLSSSPSASLEDPNSNPLSKPKALASLHLHTAPLSSIQASPSGEHILTASWDKLIGVWDTTVPSHDEVPLEHEERKKRRKVAADAAEMDAEAPRRKAPVSVLKSHTGRVMKAIFDHKGAKAYSCALDSTVRVWDVESGVCVETISASEKPFIDLISSSDGSALLAASTDRSITAYDPRLFSSSLSSSAPPAIASLTQQSTPSSLSPSPSNTHQFVSGGYDGVVRLWDVRSVKGAVASFRYTGDANVNGSGEGKGGKVLALDWARGLVGVGGENGLDVWKIGEGSNVE